MPYTVFPSIRPVKPVPPRFSRLVSTQGEMREFRALTQKHFQQPKLDPHLCFVVIDRENPFLKLFSRLLLEVDKIRLVLGLTHKASLTRGKKAEGFLLYKKPGKQDASARLNRNPKTVYRREESGSFGKLTLQTKVLADGSLLISGRMSGKLGDPGVRRDPEEYVAV